MRVRVHVYQIDGRTRVSLVDESFLPFYPLCIHLDREYGGKSINSKKSVAQDLRFFCEWLHIQSIDIEDRIVSGRML
ncbi:hypothetical protein SAMN03084138_02734 [Enterovibrio norvegicus DSM 15893]|uniref:Uncharacterized protein n=1 Tax=Enterovibrio norvegicus DSM 15893 TaxID=1121869 RepID=A0A1I5S0Q9_9GAMM|nr:hypothetical protein SAMN03084138_02734 [Enterovibrio norvegicus DSM 15893]